MNKLSKVFQPITVLPKNSIVKNQDITSKSQKLMLDLGLIKSTGSNGLFHLLPLYQKSMEKCIKLLDFYMSKVNAQKLSIPLLTASQLWKKSGRFDESQTELFLTKDRHDKLHVLGPTYEEAITDLLASIAPVSHKQFPIRLYQIGNKFRDEIKPRFGLIRTKEFIMKDCYSFDVSKESAEITYQQFNEIYEKIFKAIGVPFLKVEGDSGTIGGTKSHEFHYTADIGEDYLIHCKSCNDLYNQEICGPIDVCSKCNQKVEKMHGIEVGHTFLLDDKYSKILGATYLQANGKPSPLHMGCYGIGVTRLIAAGIESLSSEQEIRWPHILAPYTVCIIPPKMGSREEESVAMYTERIYHQLSLLNGLENDVIVDDRSGLTIGKRVMEAKRIGYPCIIVIGPKAAKPEEKFECHLVNSEKYLELSLTDLIQTIAELTNRYNHKF